MKKILGEILRYLHVLIVLFVIFGWLGPTRPWLLAHLIFIPVMILHWQTNQGRCFITDIEHDLKGTSHEKFEQDGFVKSLLRIFMKKLPENKTIKKGIYAVSGISWLISAARIALH